MFRVRSGFALAVLCLATLVACSTWAAEEKKESSDKSAKEKAAAEKVDPFVVPDGTPKELVAYIRKLLPKFFQGDRETKAKARQSIVQAADKILAAKPDKAEMAFAVDVKMHLLTDEKQLAAFADELTAGGHKKLARQVRILALKKALDQPKTAGPEKMKAAIENVVKFLETSPPEPASLELANWVIAAANPELTNDNQFAMAAYGRLAKVFAASKDPAAKGLVRRLTLPGNEMKIEGKLVGGAKFDWSKYAGKVVLVDFWATWCVPCVGEIPNMRKCYELYHDKGFEIVGMSRDHQLSDLEHFVKQKKIPWANVFGDGKPSPTYDYYGIVFTPTTILVGRDGKVVSLFVRGERLREELTKLLGPVEEKKTPEKKAAI